MNLNNLNFADVLSLLAFITALSSLVWNIVRSYTEDMIDLELEIAFGEVGSTKNKSGYLFADAGSLTPNHKFSNKGTLISVVNIGQKTIVISSIGGEYKKGEHFSMVVEGLPKVIKPYEIFQSTGMIDEKLVSGISDKKIKNIWVIDTKKKKWSISKTAWKRLETTADYIAKGKNV